MTINQKENKAKRLKWVLCLGIPAVLVILALALSPFWAEYEKPVSLQQIPASARQFIQTYYPQSKAALARKDVDWFEKEYTVILTDGVHLEFDRRGEWKKVKDKKALIPLGIVPSPVVEYIGENYPGTAIREISRDRREIEVKLTNRLELTFSTRNFLLLDIDD